MPPVLFMSSGLRAAVSGSCSGPCACSGPPLCPQRLAPTDERWTLVRSYHASMTPQTPADPSEEPLVGLKPRSYQVTDGPTRAPARAMLRAVGMTDDDWDKPQIGVASSWNEVTPCNLPLDRLAKRAKEGVREAGGFPLEFVTIAVSDGISMGHEGMRASLVSREVIADSVETVMHAERFDGLVTLAGCDKSLPGMLMAAARLNLPSVFLYGGSILPGRLGDRALDIVSVFEAVGAHAVDALSDEELSLIEHNACPTEGSARACSPPTPWRRWRRHSGWPYPGSSSPAGRGPAARRLRLRLRRGGGRPLAARHSAATGDDQGGLRERHRCRHGPGRIDQCSPPPAGHRQRGPGRARAGRLQPGGRPCSPPGRHQAPRQVPHGRPRPHRRGGGGDGRAARGRVFCTGTA